MQFVGLYYKPFLLSGTKLAPHMEGMDVTCTFGSGFAKIHMTINLPSGSCQETESPFYRYNLLQTIRRRHRSTILQPALALLIIYNDYLATNLATVKGFGRI